jgi:hypothetical protein
LSWDGRRASRAEWLNKAAVGRELGRMARELMIKQHQQAAKDQPQDDGKAGAGAARVKEALVAVVRALGGEAVDLPLMLQELLDTPPDVLPILVKR